MNSLDVKLVDALTQKISMLDKDIERLQNERQAYLTALDLLRNPTILSATNVINTIFNNIEKAVEDSKSGEIKRYKPGQALMHLFNTQPYRQWTANELVKEFNKMKAEGSLISSSKTLWTVHNGLRILEKKNPPPIKKKGNGRDAYYFKNPEVK